VGHSHLGEYFAAVDNLLKPDGIFTMQVITTPESRYEECRLAADFINTIIFPGACCPSLEACVSAAGAASTLQLEGYRNIGLHYAETLREWRRRFNAKLQDVKALGFDDVFVRTWNYYLCYCEAGFESQTMADLQLTFSRMGNATLADKQLA